MFVTKKKYDQLKLHVNLLSIQVNTLAEERKARIYESKAPKDILPKAEDILKKHNKLREENKAKNQEIAKKLLPYIGKDIANKSEEFTGDTEYSLNLLLNKSNIQTDSSETQINRREILTELVLLINSVEGYSAVTEWRNRKHHQDYTISGYYIRISVREQKQ